MKKVPATSHAPRREVRHVLGLITSAACALVAVSATADTKLITDGSPVKYHVPSDGNLGGTWRSPSFNDSGWASGQNGIGYETTPGVYSASVIADSRTEWSAGGIQGENSWINGYYNKTADADGTYSADDFQPFPRSNGAFAADNFWNGGAWAWFNGNPPWDTIGATDVHPNGINNAVEHWVIRRWHSTVGGAVTLRFHVRKSNLNGTGVTGKVFKNGVELFSRTIGGGDGTGFDVYVNTTAAAGDAFDFAHTPLGLGGDETDGADGSVMTAMVLSGTVTPPAAPITPTGVADSSADWSATGVQGANNWYYGFYNRGADADGSYDPNTDFNTTNANWSFRGGNWALGETGNPDANPPWDTIGQTSWHPNGDNQPQGNHWVIRRWVSEVDGDIYANVKFAKANTSGNGTTLHVLHNGVEAYAVTLNNTAGVDVNVPLPGAFVGDKIDFALDPKGVDGLFGDGSDTSTFTAAIFTGTPPQSTVADSVADWSAAGAQGANGWFYGFYNETADADAAYNPNTDFNTTDSNWSFTGGNWVLGEAGNPDANPPWDTIGATEWHPNGDNQTQGVHWVIKRWVSDADGDLHANVQFGKANTGSGNGVTLRVLQNGAPVFTKTIAFNDGTGINTNVNLPGVLIGDKIEFALDPLGTDGGKGDGADGSYIRVKILSGLAPVPPRPFLPGIADTFQTDVGSAMKGVNPSVYVRIPFNVADPAAIDSLKLKMKYNDGFVAYLNGVEVVRRNTPTAIAGSTIADSIADWSTNPDVTVNGWSYGYYDQSLDSDGAYSGGTDLTPFPHDGGGYSATDFWQGTGWDWFAGNPPWTEVFQETTHPNHPNGGVVDPGNPGTHHQWTARRWTATVDANLKCRVRFRKTNPNCGDGVRVVVFHNSTQVYSQTIAFNDSVGRDDTIDIPDVFIGDNVDVLLGPGDGNDFCDGSAFSMVLFEGEPTIPWNGLATASRTTSETIAPEVIDISSLISELRAGANVLAIQGFNAGVNDNEFVINAGLLANQSPAAVDDAVTATADTPADFAAAALLANDTDPDGDKLVLVGVTPTYTTAAGGTVRLYGSVVKYTPPAGFIGADAFTYTVSDGSTRQSGGTVRVNVLPVNQLPAAVDDTVTTETGSSVIVSVLANDSDADSDTLTVTAVTAAANGVAIISGDNTTVTYSPNAGFRGSDSFRYTISDGKGGTASAEVRVTVSDTVPPTITCPGDYEAVAANEAGAVVTYVATASDAGGIASLVCVPASGSTFALGETAVTCTATDNAGNTASCSFRVTVRPSMPPPTAVIGTDALVDFSPDYENPVLISCNWWNACLVLDGWTSSASDGGALTYLWFDELEPVPFDGGVVVTNCYEVGTHTITLIVTDSKGLTDSDSKTIEVVTAPLAVELLIEKVNQSRVPRSVKRELVAALRAALASAKADKGRPTQTTLDAFEKKVRAKIADAYPEEARVWIKWSQAISAGMEKCMKPPRKAKDHWDKKKSDDKK